MANCLARRRAHCNNLPEDIIYEEILTRLPVKSLLRFRAVCKSWRTLISNPKFKKSHLTRTSVNPNQDFLLLHSVVSGEYDEITTLSRVDLSQTSVTTDSVGELRLVGSINGLVCVSKEHRFFNNVVQVFYIWNPATKQILSVPCKFVYPKENAWFGFGFDPLANDFKVICMTKNYEVGGDIYSCNADSWKQVHSNNNLDFPSACQNCIVNVNGCPYWMYDLDGVMSGVSFDVRNEAFRLLPDLVFDKNIITKWKWSAVNLKGSVATMVYNDSSSLIGAVEVYSLDDEGSSCGGGGGGVWSKMYTVGPTPFYKSWPWPLQCFKNGEILFRHTWMWLLHDPKSNTIESLGNRKGHFQNGFSYIETLVFVEGMKPCTALQIFETDGVLIDQFESLSFCY